jgi:anti-sigma factor RsiW
MAWMYGETSADESAILKRHLGSCTQCEAQVKSWRAAMRELDEWPVPAPTDVPSLSAWWSHGWKWAAAVAVLLTAGFLAGRVNSNASPAALNASVEKNVARQMELARTELAADVTQKLLNHVATINESNRVEVARLLSELTASINESRTADQQNVLAALKELDARWLGIYASFRRELETVAILTETGLNDTQQQLVQMANFNDTIK